MILAENIHALLSQLSATLRLVSTSQFTQKMQWLNGATIGQHTRHIIELFQELLNGYESGTVNYGNRKRNLLIETDKEIAVQLLSEISNTIRYKTDKTLILAGNYTVSENNNIEVSTNFFRELICNMDHTIHHMALMRVIIEHWFNIPVDNDFGVAPATLKYRLSCAP